MSDFDVVVIGGGPAGSVSGALLAKLGRKVLIVEGADILGGRSRTYDAGQFASLDELVTEYEGAGARILTKTDELAEAIAKRRLEGFHFELGEHGIAGAHLLRTGYIADHLGCELEIKPTVGAMWDHEGELFEIVKGEPLPWLSDQEYRDVRAISKQMMALSDEEVDQLDDVGFGQWMRTISDAEVAMKFHGSMATMNTGPAHPDNISTGEHMRINRQILRAGAHITWAGIGFPVPGYGAIPEAFHSAFERLGGVTRLGSAVEEIVVEGGIARGVRVGGEVIRAEQVLCTLPVPLIGSILPRNEVLDRDLERYAGFTGGAAMTFYIGCHEPVVEDEGAWYTSPRIASAEEGYSGDLISGWVASSNSVPERAPAGRQLFESWCGLTTEEAGKPELVANAMKRQWEKLTSLHPNLEAATEWKLVTLAPRAYPVLPSPGQVYRSLVDVEPGWYENLYLAGDSVRSWGCSIDQSMHASLLAVERMSGEPVLEILPDYQR